MTLLQSTLVWTLVSLVEAGTAPAPSERPSPAQTDIVAASAVACVGARSYAGPVVNVRDFGAAGDGSTDDGAALDAAVHAAAASGGTVMLPPGVYSVGRSVHVAPTGYLNNAFIELQSGVAIVGSGPATVVRVSRGVQSQAADQGTGHVFQGVGVSNVTIRDLVIDMNGGENLTPRGRLRNGHALRFLGGGANVRIENVTVLDNPGHNDIAANGAGHCFTVTGCLLKNGGRYVSGTRNQHNADFSFVDSEWAETNVESNRIVQESPDEALRGYSGGIELHGSHSSARHNELTGCDPAVWVVSAPFDISSILVADNRMRQCVRGVAFWNARKMGDIAIERNAIEIYRPAASPTPTAVGIQQPNGQLADFTPEHANGTFIEGLRITDNRVTCSLPSGSVLLARGIELHSVKNAVVSGNRIDGMTESCAVLQGSPWGIANLLLERNEFTNCGRGAGLRNERRVGLRVNVGGTARTPMGPLFLSGLTVRDNLFGNVPASASEGGEGIGEWAGVTFAHMGAPASAAEIRVEGNRFVGVARNVVLDPRLRDVVAGGT